MSTHLRANLWMLVLTLLLGSVIYPGLLLLVGQAAFHDKAQGSLLTDGQGKPIGSRLIAQPFTADEYFQPRPSSPSYNAAASGATNWAASNYLLRDRVARQLGTLVTYRSGDKKRKPVGPDIEAWFQQDQYQGKPGIVAQWAAAHNTIAQNWVKTNNDPASQKLASAYVTDWQKSHTKEVDAWKKDNPRTPQPEPEDLAVPFFMSFSKDHPGMFPSIVEHKSADGKSIAKRVEPVKEGNDIQAVFFDMWLAEHPTVDLTPVPSDMVMASGSGLDPHVTLNSALFQLDRVAAAWAEKTGGDEAKLRGEIEKLLRQESSAPLGGLLGVPLVNVLEINLALRERYAKKSR